MALCLTAQQATADVYGVVIGIDAYKNYGTLDGAVNDAKIVADSLNAVGAKQVKLLLDDKATRDEIKKAWDDVSVQAKKGDTIFFTYAGHGAQLPERVKNTEEDGQDEFYVLANFEDSGKNTYERLIDDDLQEWFSKRPDLNIILVSDSCHSGTMTRSYKKSKLKYRKAQVRAITNDILPVSNNPYIVDEKKTKLAHVISFSGVPDNEEVPEVKIDNQPHGALSWHFAKGLIGLADENKDGVVSLSELKNYLIEKVRMETDGQQHPQISFVTDMALVQPIDNLLENNHVRLEGDLKPITFSINKDSDIKAFTNAVIEKLSGIQLVESEKAILEWDVDGGVIRNQFNDIIYNFSIAENQTRAFRRKDQNTDIISQETINRLQLIINKFRLIDKLKLLSDGSLELKLQPGDKLHANGEAVIFEVDRLKYPYFTLINLAVDGTINFLYPSIQYNDPLIIQKDKPYKLELDVSEPFGADHFVAIVSDKPLSSLHETLKKLNNTSSSLEELRKTLQTALKETNFQIGIHASFTASSL